MERPQSRFDKKDENILIIDDLIATGGTAEAITSRNFKSCWIYFYNKPDLVEIKN